MELKEQFDNAVLQSKAVAANQSAETLLQLYSLFKQAMEGDVSGERPGGFDFKAIAKFDAWKEQKGKSKEQAMKEYVDLIQQLQQR